MRIRINFDFLNDMLEIAKKVGYEFKKFQKENEPSFWTKEVKFEEVKNDKGFNEYSSNNTSSGKSS